VNRHPSVKMTTPDGEEVDIDERIVDLIRSCWDAGIRTQESCQDFEDNGSDLVFVSFPTPDDYLNFARVVVEGGARDELYDRIAGVRDHGWEWALVPLDAEWVESEPPPDNVPVRAGFLAHVIFPLFDVDGVVGRLRSAR